MASKRAWSTFEEDYEFCHHTQPDDAPEATRRNAGLFQGIAEEGCQIAPVPSTVPNNGLPKLACYGSIVDVKSLLKGNPGELRKLCLQSTRVFDVRTIGSYFGMYSEDTLVAILSKTSCKLISKLIKMQRCQATVKFRHWMAALQERERGQSQPMMEVELIIYGLKDDALSVGETLSEFGITLQPPTIGLNGTTYYNPHYLEISHSSEEDIFCLELAPSENSNAQGTTGATASDKIDVSIEIARILDSLSYNTFLREHVVDGQIKSELLPHQRSAIDFVFRTEMGETPRNLRMWQHVDRGEDSHFQHIITGSRSKLSQEAKGGIIADEMGLGKSLVMLSAIAGSFDRAIEHTKRINKDAGLGSDIDNAIQSSATLVVVPSSLLIDNWIAEIRKHIYPGNLTFYKYHGHKRKEFPQELFQSHIVFSTYATIAAEARQRSSPLAAISWFRIVLDEAHDIRNRSTQQFRALRSLRAEHRWCLTGTPIQNSLEDLGSLVTFLKVPAFEDPATFRHFISRQCKSSSRQSFQALKTLLSAICLRRTREVINLPEPIQRRRVLELTEMEREQYMGIVEDSKQMIQMAVSMRGKMKHNTAVLLTLLRLRLFCNNGSAEFIQTANSKGVPTDPYELLTYLQQTDDAVCVFCQNEICNIVAEHNSDSDSGIRIKECLHLVCGYCMPQYHAEKSQCPSCSSEGHGKQLEDRSCVPNKEETYLPGSESDVVYPTKLRAFMKDLQDDFRTHGCIKKSIAFSSWKKTLDLASKLLQANGIGSYCIHGSLPASERAKILTDFHSPLGRNVLLMTIGTGGIGQVIWGNSTLKRWDVEADKYSRLNLANATRVYILEPQWNPSMELQAIGRAFRLGQEQQVTITRYITKETIEDAEVLQRQERKLQLADGGFAQKPKNLSCEKAETLSGSLGLI